MNLKYILNYNYFRSTDYGDELAWAAAWLYKATNMSYYLDEADHLYSTFRLKVYLFIFAKFKLQSNYASIFYKSTNVYDISYRKDLMNFPWVVE